MKRIENLFERIKDQPTTVQDYCLTEGALHDLSLLERRILRRKVAEYNRWNKISTIGIIGIMIAVWCSAVNIISKGQ